MTTTTPRAGRAASDADYQRLGLSRGTVAPWEDGRLRLLRHRPVA